MLLLHHHNCLIRLSPQSCHCNAAAHMMVVHTQCHSHCAAISIMVSQCCHHINASQCCCHNDATVTLQCCLHNTNVTMLLHTQCYHSSNSIAMLSTHANAIIPIATPPAPAKTSTILQQVITKVPSQAVTSPQFCCKAVIPNLPMQCSCTPCAAKHTMSQSQWWHHNHNVATSALQSHQCHSSIAVTMLQSYYNSVITTQCCLHNANVTMLLQTQCCHHNATIPATLLQCYHTHNPSHPCSPTSLQSMNISEL